MKKIIKSVFVIMIGLALVNTLLNGGNKEKNVDKKRSEDVKETTKTSTKENKKNVDIDWLQDYSNKGIEIQFVPADMLYSYGQVYAEQVVVTAFDVNSKSRDSLKTTTDNNDSFAFSIVSYFDDEDEISHIEEDDSVIIIGKVKKDDEFKIDLLGTGQTVSMENCHIVSTGVTKDEIEIARARQEIYVKAQTEIIQQAKAEEELATKQDYINQCTTVNYADVERNPNQYKGKYIYVSGSVVQVSEGWFDTVTIRLDQGYGNDWYVTYTRKDENESRILEGDWITVYGICDGVTTYTSVLGNKITIPALDAEYYQ